MSRCWTRDGRGALPRTLLLGRRVNWLLRWKSISAATAAIQADGRADHRRRSYDEQEKKLDRGAGVLIFTRAGSIISSGQAPPHRRRIL
jgi:hypothetical protein